MTPEEVKQYDDRRGAAHVYHSSGVLLQSTTSILAPILLKKGAPDVRSSLIAAVLLYAISSEVALKAILIKEGKVPTHSHDLKVMFEDLNDQTKEDIKNRVEFSNFDSELEKIRKSFVEWRYFYEGGSKSINIDFLRNFSKAVNSLTL